MKKQFSLIKSEFMLTKNRRIESIGTKFHHLQQSLSNAIFPE